MTVMRTSITIGPTNGRQTARAKGWFRFAPFRFGRIVSYNLCLPTQLGSCAALEVVSLLVPTRCYGITAGAMCVCKRAALLTFGSSPVTIMAMKGLITCLVRGVPSGAHPRFGSGSERDATRTRGACCCSCCCTAVRGGTR